MGGKKGKKSKYHTDDRGHFVWDYFFVGGKQKRTKRRVTVIDEKIIDDMDQFLMDNADDWTLHSLERWDLIGQRLLVENPPPATPMTMKTPRKTPLRIAELEEAFDWLSDAMHMGYEETPTLGFLDLTTGKVCTPEDEDQADDCLVDNNLMALPDDLFEDLHRGLLDDFVSTLGDHPARGKITQAIRGKGAFRRFKDIVVHGGDAELKHRWDWHETCAKRKLIELWLIGENIDPVWDCDIFQEPPMPGKRRDLLQAVSEFVAGASKLTGVRRIALIGSLVTGKAIPKDVDLLIGVDDGMPLDELARLSRRLNGKTMATGDGCGAEVFLHDPEGTYLGRICHWKQCAPGIRQGCKARHCGRRTYLSDDLQVIELEANLIDRPPLVLWPVINALVAVPDDVRTTLMGGAGIRTCHLPGKIPPRHH